MQIVGTHRYNAWLQTEADAAAKQADIRIKHLQKQLNEQQKALNSKQKEGSKLQSDLDKERAAVEQCRWVQARRSYGTCSAARFGITAAYLRIVIAPLLPRHTVLSQP